ncbi:fam-i protein [Plasmodium gallinaceum]|uniref:Fam-i protein n=1 Tax=Plasmodium gallinaceum TaxID=5849 RepID=A0A1J1GYK0_PLAGA|nr:fam-i protein [Plasmodium gallinaceum]CRG97391.1 fam-i protein [Plasmodium gallinaceum]
MDLRLSDATSIDSSHNINEGNSTVGFAHRAIEGATVSIPENPLYDDLDLRDAIQNPSEDINLDSNSSMNLHHKKLLSIFQLVMIIISFLRFARTYSPKLRAKHKERVRLQNKWNNRDKKMNDDWEKMEEKWNERKQKENREKEELNKKKEERKKKTSYEMEQFNRKWDGENYSEEKSCKFLNYSCINGKCIKSLNEPSTRQAYNKTVKKKKKKKVLLDIIEEKLKGISFKKPLSELELEKMRREMLFRQVVELNEKWKKYEEHCIIMSQWEKNKRKKLEEKRRERRGKHENEMLKEKVEWEKSMREEKKEWENIMREKNKKWEKNMRKEKEKWEKSMRKKKKKWEKSMMEKNEMWKRDENIKVNEEESRLNLKWKKEFDKIKA